LVQFREEIQNGPSESVQYELVARRYADTPIRRYIALLWLRLRRAVIFAAFCSIFFDVFGVW
jgi:hypothetical protein